MRLAAERPREFQNRTHFLAIAALSMRQILVQRARARRAIKRGGAPERVTLDDSLRRRHVGAGFRDADAFGAARDVDLLALDEALTRLADFDPELVRIVELRYFGGPHRRRDRRGRRRLAGHRQAAVGHGARVAEAGAQRAPRPRAETSVTGERWNQLKERVRATRSSSRPSRAPAWLARACAGDHELGSQAEALLDAYEQDPEFLEGPARGRSGGSRRGARRAAACARSPPGTILGDGQYQIVGELGRGGMGIVYVAQDLRLPRHVALKSLPEAARRDPVRLERLRREAWAAARITDPAVATIYAFEELDGQPFIVSEYVRGRHAAQP